ncbi:adhesion regulating molecule [Gonapodya prolifera JEL478]|uniref:Adhesion regulating molecule n=1 Tax=Gonapodya prolifera (strain JEL478) TaxID=1344416 RepID=A0A139AR70_GONPJ|nr:adhesion regulating molecule [Gonapodya prolifera JEL478]|eukprot:KXS19251.1 adhesion regulating molecule [Gonapodya prolifera JEL478]
MSAPLPANVFAAAAAPKSSNIVEFKAGKLFRDGSMVKPDPRRGLIYLYKSDDGLLHFVWKDRKTNAIEDDWIVFPMEATFMAVTQSKSRVFMLKFESSSAKHFYWMQEPSSEKDTSVVAKINQAINGESGDEDVSPGSSDSSDIPMVSAPSTAPPEPPVATPSSAAGPGAAAGGAAQNQLQQIRDLIAGITVPQGMEDVELSDAFSAEKVSPVLENSAALQALFPHLPDDAPRTKEEVAEVVRSPQFKQQLRRLQAASKSAMFRFSRDIQTFPGYSRVYLVRTGQLGPLLQSIGLDPNLATVRDFLKSIQEKMDNKMDES